MKYFRLCFIWSKRVPVSKHAAAKTGEYPSDIPQFSKRAFFDNI